MRLSKTIFLLLFCWNHVVAQNFGYCVQQKSYQGEISSSAKKFLGKEQLSVKYTINLCYTGNNELVAKINRQFYKNDNRLEGKKLQKSLSRLFLENVSINGDKEFAFKVDPPDLVEDGSTYVLAPRENVKWENKSIVISHLFRYEMDGISNSEELTCAITIPDGSTIKEKPVLVVQKVEQKKQQAVAKPMQNQQNFIEPKIVETNIQAYNCIDSVRFYYHRITSRYNRMVEKPKPVGNELLQLKQGYQNDANLFEYFAESCNHPKTKSYLGEYKRVVRQLNKILADTSHDVYTSAGTETNTSNDEFAVKQNRESKKSVELKTGVKSIRYLIIGVIGMVLVGFMFFKYGKKINKKRK